MAVKIERKPVVKLVIDDAEISATLDEDYNMVISDTWGDTIITIPKEDIAEFIQAMDELYSEIP